MFDQERRGLAAAGALLADDGVVAVARQLAKSVRQLAQRESLSTGHSASAAFDILTNVHKANVAGGDPVGELMEIDLGGLALGIWLHEHSFRRRVQAGQSTGAD
jgi:hypothetical protein